MEQLVAVLAREQRRGPIWIGIQPPFSVPGQNCDHLAHQTVFCSKQCSQFWPGNREGVYLDWYLAPLSLSLAKTATTQPIRKLFAANSVCNFGQGTEKGNNLDWYLAPLSLSLAKTATTQPIRILLAANSGRSFGQGTEKGNNLDWHPVPFFCPLVKNLSRNGNLDPNSSQIPTQPIGKALAANSDRSFGQGTEKGANLGQYLAPFLCPWPKLRPLSQSENFFCSEQWSQFWPGNREGGQFGLVFSPLSLSLAKTATTWPIRILLAANSGRSFGQGTETGNNLDWHSVPFFCPLVKHLSENGNLDPNSSQIPIFCFLRPSTCGDFSIRAPIR